MCPSQIAILAVANRELEKSPEEIAEFQDQDVRDFCDMNYEMGGTLLGLVYAFLIKKWNLSSQDDTITTGISERS